MKAVVDAVYGETVRLLLGEQESMAIDVPLHELPGGLQPGMVIQIKFTIDDAATKLRKQKQNPSAEMEKYGWRKLEYE